MQYTEAQKRELEKEYESIFSLLKEAEKRLLDLLHLVILRIADKALVRAEVGSTRIKPVDSVRRKAETSELNPNEVCWSINDLVGARVVCNTVEDVYRFRELIREVLPLDGPVDEQDHIAMPKQSGYRAVHLNFRIEIGGPLRGLLVPCEVQIRTLLQDSWAELAHRDIYKEGTTLPEDLHGRTQDLANILASADQMASRIRARVKQETVVKPKSIQLNALTKEGLNYIFAEVFGRLPPDYAVQRAYEKCKDVGIATVASLQEKLSNKIFREMLLKAYRDVFPYGSELSAEDMLSLIPVAVARGDKRAVNEARKLAKAQRDEIEAVWRREALGALPESYETFVEEIEAGNMDLESIAEALGIARQCFVCNDLIVDDYAFLESISAHYDVKVDYELINVLPNVADCWINAEHPNLCSYHAYQANKDD